MSNNKEVSEFTDFREDFLKLQKVVNDLEVKVQQQTQMIENLNERNVQLCKESSEIREEYLRLFEENRRSEKNMR